MNCSEFNVSRMYLLCRLGNNSEIVQSVNRSQIIMRSIDNNDVIEYRPLPLLHTTLNYFCCHTVEVRLLLTESLTLASISYPFSGETKDPGGSW